ncbi:MAG TPA: extracellular solute-binding protein, partial [Candidatus Avipropionibacterium avicola]|nr:extracellular solute-binding protein [Candidatus Avipropionibacterium avicola]
MPSPITSQSPFSSRRRFLAAVGGAGTAAVLAGCSGGKGLPGSDSSGDTGDGTGTIQWWTNHTEEDTALFRERIKAFNEVHPDIKVNLLNIADGPQYYTKINTSAVSGGVADVFYTRSFDIAPFVARDWLLPLADLIEQDRDEVQPDDFWPAEVAQLSVDEVMYALPYDFSNFAIYVNKTLLDSKGIAMPDGEWTWEEMLEMGKEFVEREGKRQTRWGAGLSTTNWLMMGIFKAYDGATFSEDLSSCVVADHESNIKLLESWEAQMKAGVVPAADATPEGVDIFASQLVPFNVNGSWATLATRAAVNDKFEWDVARLPKGSSGRRDISAAGGAWSISKSSKNQAAAWTFLKFITSEDSTNALIAEPTRSVPGRQSSAERWAEVAASGAEPPKSVQIFADQLGDDA